MLGEHKAGFRREGHINMFKMASLRVIINRRPMIMNHRLTITFVSPTVVSALELANLELG